MSRWLGVIVTLGGAFLVGFLVITEFLLPQVVGHGRDVVVPDMAGQEILVVMDDLVRSRLIGEVRVERADALIPEGVVILQDPPAGSVVKVGRTVGLTVSMGPERGIVPTLAGRSLRQAAIDLASEGLIRGEVLRVASPEFAEGQVISSSPLAGTEALKGAPVNLMVSMGPRPARMIMPDLSGLPYDLVRRELTRRGFRVERARYLGSVGGVEEVTGQEPAAGEPVGLDSRIALTVGGA